MKILLPVFCFCLALLAGCVSEPDGVVNACVIPMVVRTDPVANDSAVPLSKTLAATRLAKANAVKVITATFNTPMDPASINRSTFILTVGTDTVRGSVSYSDTTAYFIVPNDLAPGLTYTATIKASVRERAIGTNMTADYVWSFTTVGAGTPTLSSPSNGATGQSTSPTLTWYPVSGASSYHVQVSQTPSFISFVADTVVTATSAHVTGLTGTYTYYWRVNALIFGETGPWSATWRFTTQAPPDMPVQTSPTAAALNQATSPTFTWEPAARASNYRLQVSTSPTFLTPVFDDSTINGTSRLVTGLLRGTQYYWRLRGQNGSGNSPWATRSFTTTTSLLQPPVLAAPANGSTNRPTDPVLSWNASTGADTYRVQVSTTSAFLTTVVNDSTISGLSRQVTGLSNGVTYYWRVNAKDSSGTSAYSTIWSFTVANLAAPTVPLGAAARFGGMGGSAGVTNQGTLTRINGSLSTTAQSSLVTGFHDGTGGPSSSFSETTLNIGLVRDTIYTATAPPGSVPGAAASQALADANTAYLYLAALPAGSDPGAGELGGQTLSPGTYSAASGTFKITLSDLTLDAQGDPNARFVFQIATALTVGTAGPAGARSVILLNGAQAKNVFWQVGSAATINGAGGGTMVGTIIARSGVTLSTVGNGVITRLDGRALSLISSVTMTNTVINVPNP